MGVWDALKELLDEAERPSLKPHAFIHALEPGRYMVVNTVRKCDVIFQIRKTHSTWYALETARKRAFKPLYIVNVKPRHA